MKKLSYGLLGFLVLASFILGGCDGPNKVHKGDIVDITYTANFADGTAFQTSGMSFTVGSGTALAGLEEGVLGMKANETKTITIAPEKGYGNQYNQQLVQRIPKIVFDKIKVDVQIGVFQKLGDSLEGIIKGIEKDDQDNEVVLFDMNPRETWDTLVYKVTLVSKK